MNKSESIANLASALVAAQSEMGNAVKGASNPFFKSRFADLNAIREAVIPVLNKHSIMVLQPMSGDTVETVLVHESGEWMSSATPIVCAKQNDPQALGSAISYARRYGLQAMVCIGAVDDDSESAMDRKVETKAATTTPTTKSSFRPQTSAASAASVSVTSVTTKTDLPKTNTTKGPTNVGTNAAINGWE